MIELLWAMLFLGIAAGANWLLGLYDKIGVEQLAWDWRSFFRGITKILIICGVAIGLGFAWEYSGIDLSGAGLEPLTVTTTATIYFAFKAIKRLATIIYSKARPEEIVEEVPIVEDVEVAVGEDATDQGEE